MAFASPAPSACNAAFTNGPEISFRQRWTRYIGPSVCIVPARAVFSMRGARVARASYGLGFFPCLEQLLRGSLFCLGVVVGVQGGLLCIVGFFGVFEDVD